MLDFLRGDADVLVCTTIIESGLDISIANTLIVERADELGLAQLYQIRGRVGRSARARLRLPASTPRAAALTEEAARAPLDALRLHRARARASRSPCATSRSAAPATCWATSSRATWPRSASSCTCGMLDEAVAALAGRLRRRRRPSRSAIDVPVDAFVPGDYVPYEAAKIEIHRRVSGAKRGGRPDHAARGAGGPLRPRARAARATSSSLQDARIKLGRAGATRRRLQPGAGCACRRSSSTRAGSRRCASEIPEAVYESGRSTVAVRVPDDAGSPLPRAGRGGGGDPRGGADPDD